MGRKYIVSVGYNDLLAPSAEVALSILECIPLKDKRINHIEHYVHTHELKVSMKTVDESLILESVPEESSDAI